MTLADIGVVLDSFGQPVKESLQSAARLSFRTVEMPVIGGEVDPASLSRTARRHLRHYVSSLGLELSALGADLGGGRFTDRANAERCLEKTCEVMTLAAELGVLLITTHLGRLDDGGDVKGHIREAMQILAEAADRTGTFLAFETAAADPTTIAGLLGEVGSSSLGVCYDPASLLIDGYDPLAGFEPLANRILIARARDALAGGAHRAGREAPLGQGQLDLPAYLAALDEAGYRRVPFIRRTESDRPLDELADARRRVEACLR